MFVDGIMISDPISCASGEPVQLAARLIRDHNLDFLPVMTDREQRTLQGVITGRDICIHVVAEALSSTETPLSEVMTRPPVVCRSGSTVEHAMRIMKTLRLRRLPVVDDKGRLIGVVKLEQVLGQGLVGSSDMCRDLTEAFATSRGANLCLTGRGGLPFASRV